MVMIFMSNKSRLCEKLLINPRKRARRSQCYLTLGNTFMQTTAPCPSVTHRKGPTSTSGVDPLSPALTRRRAGKWCCFSENSTISALLFSEAIQKANGRFRPLHFWRRKTAWISQPNTCRQTLAKLSTMQTNPRKAPDVRE